MIYFNARKNKCNDTRVLSEQTFYCLFAAALVLFWCQQAHYKYSERLDRRALAHAEMIKWSIDTEAK